MNPTHYDDTQLGILQRKHVMDVGLLLNAMILFAVLLTGWYIRVLDLELQRVAWAFFIYGAIHTASMPWSDSFRTRRLLLGSVTLAACASVTFLGFAWHLAGGVSNPVFLTGMIAPVAMAAALRLRRVAGAAAVSSIVVVTAVALAESPELRWFVERYGLPLPVSGGHALATLPGVETTPSSMVFALALFAVVQICVLIAVIAASTAASRLGQRFAASAQPVSEAAHAALISSPDPTVVVYADTAQMHTASRSFVNQMLLRADDLKGRTIFELMDFPDEEIVYRAIREGDALSGVSYSIGPEARLADLFIHRFASAGDRFAAIRFDERIDDEASLDGGVVKLRGA